MDNALLFSLVLGFVLATFIMFLIPETMFPKKEGNEAGLSKAELLKRHIKKGYYRRVFLISSFITIVIILLIKYVVFVSF